MTNLPAEYWIVVVTGAFASGKTCFVDSIGEENEALQNSDFDSPVLAYGKTISLDDVILFLLTPPGARRFDFMWETMANGRMIGFVVMINSANPTSFRDSKSVLETFRVYSGAPCVVAANFQDHPNAWDAETLHHLMRLPDDIPVVPCVATEKESVKQVLIALLEKVIEAIDANGYTEDAI